MQGTDFEGAWILTACRCSVCECFLPWFRSRSGEVCWRSLFGSRFLAVRALDLSYIKFNYSSPSSLSKLHNLTMLLLISNNISGSIPHDVGKCSSLIRLHLYSSWDWLPISRLVSDMTSFFLFSFSIWIQIFIVLQILSKNNIFF